MGISKAAAGGVVGVASDFVTYLLTTYIPGLAQLPPDQIQNLEILITGSLVALAVYFTPHDMGSMKKETT